MTRGKNKGNCAHHYIGKICFLLLVRADYIGRARARGPEGMGNCSSCYEAQANLKVKTQS